MWFLIIPHGFSIGLRNVKMSMRKIGMHLFAFFIHICVLLPSKAGVLLFPTTLLNNLRKKYHLSKYYTVYLSLTLR